MHEAEEFAQGVECSNFRKYVVVIWQNHPRAQCYTVAFRLLSQFLKHGSSTGLRPHVVSVLKTGRREEVVGPITNRVRWSMPRKSPLQALSDHGFALGRRKLAIIVHASTSLYGRCSGYYKRMGCIWPLKQQLQT